MKRLFLFRHAKSSWSDPALSDHNRPLNNRGMRDAPKMGRYVRKQGYALDWILCSSAVRTRDTLRLALPELIANGVPSINFKADIYEATPRDILACIRGVPALVENLMVIGHSPGLDQLVLALTGDDPDAQLDNIREKFPTAALAVIDFDCTGWCDVGETKGTLIDFTSPKRLGT